MLNMYQIKYSTAISNWELLDVKQISLVIFCLSIVEQISLIVFYSWIGKQISLIDSCLLIVK